MKTSTTKKLLVTIALTSAGISVDFAFAGPRPPRSNSEPISKLVYDISDTTNTSSELKTEKCLSDYYLNVAVKYFPPEVRKKVMLINKRCSEAILKTECYIDYWWMWLLMLDKYRTINGSCEPFDKILHNEEPIPIEYIEDVLRDIFPAQLPTLHVIDKDFKKNLFDTIEVYQVDFNKIRRKYMNDLREELKKINPIFDMCIIGNCIVIPRGKYISDDFKQRINSNKKYNKPVNSDDLIALRKFADENFYTRTEFREKDRLFFDPDKYIKNIKNNNINPKLKVSKETKNFENYKQNTIKLKATPRIYR